MLNSRLRLLRGKRAWHRKAQGSFPGWEVLCRALTLKFPRLLTFWISSIIVSSLQHVDEEIQVDREINRLEKLRMIMWSPYHHQLALWYLQTYSDQSTLPFSLTH